MNGWRNMDESCGIGGFCMEAELKTNQARGGRARKGTETGNRWSGFALRKCARGARILLHQKNPSHARTQFLKPNCRRLVYQRRPIPLSPLAKTFMHVCSVVMED
jgi:hypothetical protein